MKTIILLILLTVTLSLYCNESERERLSKKQDLLEKQLVRILSKKLLPIESPNKKTYFGYDLEELGNIFLEDELILKFEAGIPLFELAYIYQNYYQKDIPIFDINKRVMFGISVKNMVSGGYFFKLNIPLGNGE